MSIAAFDLLPRADVSPRIPRTRQRALDLLARAAELLERDASSTEGLRALHEAALERRCFEFAGRISQRLLEVGGAAGDDHSIEVFRDHYAQTTTVRTISAQTVIRAQQKVLKRAVEGPVLVTATARDVAATDDGDPEVVRLATQVAQETATEQELTLSACRDPHDGPLSQPGELCHASPSMCLQCRNAVIFREHLPRLLAYENTLDSLKKTLPPIAYSEFYGQQTVNLKSVIDQFTADDVARARERATLHRPLGERAEQ